MCVGLCLDLFNSQWVDGCVGKLLFVCLLSDERSHGDRLSELFVISVVPQHGVFDCFGS